MPVTFKSIKIVADTHTEIVLNGSDSDDDMAYVELETGNQTDTLVNKNAVT